MTIKRRIRNDQVPDGRRIRNDQAVFREGARAVRRQVMRAKSTEAVFCYRVEISKNIYFIELILSLFFIVLTLIVRRGSTETKVGQNVGRPKRGSAKTFVVGFSSLIHFFHIVFL